MMFKRLWQRANNERQEERPTATRSVHVMISGRVQGVGYRAWTHREAQSRRLAGWVCNRRNGSVEAVFSGDPEAVASMLVAVRNGPTGSRVESVEIVEDDAGNETVKPANFTVNPTY